MSKMVAIALMLLWSVAARAQSGIDTLYFLPKTVVTISGTVTTKKSFTTNGLVDSSEPGPATIQVGVAADPSSFYFYQADSSLLSKNSVVLELTQAGFISGINGVSEGQAGVILRNILGFVTGIAKIGTGGLPFSADSPVETFYLADFPEQAKRRGAVRAAIESMLDQSLARQNALVAEPDPKKRDEIRMQLGDLGKGLTTLRAEAEALDAHFSAWKTRKEDKKEQSYEWVIDVDSLLPHASVDGQKLDAIVAKATPLVKDVIAKLRIVISVESPALSSAPAPPTAGTHSAALYHRVVLPSTVRVYRIGADDSLELVKQSGLGVLSASSAIGTLPAPNSKWSKKSLTATFVDGALIKVSAETTSELAAASEALRGLPGEYLASVKQANEIAAEQRKLGLQSIEARIDQLKKQKELAEADLAQQQALSVGPAKSAITDLETQIKLLETQRAFNDATSTGGDRNALRLDNEMTKLQIEQAELRKKLEALEKEIRR